MEYKTDFFQKKYITSIKNGISLITKEYDQYLNESKLNLLNYNKLINTIENSETKIIDMHPILLHIETFNKNNDKNIIEIKKILKNQEKLYNNFLHHYKLIYNIEYNIEDSISISSNNKDKYYKINRDNKDDTSSIRSNSIKSKKINRDNDTSSTRSTQNSTKSKKIQTKFFSIFKN